jgi:hypothetical protein
MGTEKATLDLLGFAGEASEITEALFDFGEQRAFCRPRGAQPEQAIVQCIKQQPPAAGPCMPDPKRS